MVKHTQTIRRQQALNCLSAINCLSLVDHFWRLRLKGLNCMENSIQVVLQLGILFKIQYWEYLFLFREQHHVMLTYIYGTIQTK